MSEPLDLKELVEWSKSISRAAREYREDHWNADADVRVAARFVALCMEVRNVGKATTLDFLRITPYLDWIKKTARRCDRLGYACNEFLMRYEI